MTGLLQSIPDDPDTMIVVESTANGMGGAFYDLWTAAQTGENDFLPIFFGWWEHPEYVRSLEVRPEQFQDTLSNEEVALQREGVQLEQLNWRRWAIRNKCEGKVERFKQEYPSTPEEAFQASGRMRIPSHVVALHRAKPASRGELRYEWVANREVARFTDNESGALSVWDLPGVGKNYVIGCDAAEGVDANEDLGSSDPDYSVADVFSWPAGVQVAQLRERLTPSELGHYLYDLGRWFNWALIGLEINGPGQGTLQVLLDRGYPVDKIAKRMVYDGAGTPVGSKYGLKVTQVNREIIISGLENALAAQGDGGIILRSQVSINELYTFHIVKGKPQAISGRHDDTVFSAAHGVEAMKQAAGVFSKPQVDTRMVEPVRYAQSRRQMMRESY